MADEQEESHEEADSKPDESERAEERTAEELGEELLARLDELEVAIESNTAELASVRAELEAVNQRLAEYARAEHEHPHEHQHDHSEYARGDHNHAESTESGSGSGEEKGSEERRESAPRSNHPYYREWPPWKH